MKSLFFKQFSYWLKRRIVKSNPLWEINRCYKKALGVYPNLKTPKNLIEKIYWMEWNSDTSLWTKCADKYRVREFLKEQGLEHIAPKLLGIWHNVEDIDFSELPQEFILKTNDGCGTNLIVRDKSKYDVEQVKKLFKSFMKYKQGFSNAQYHYLEIEPCVIAEELLHQSDELNEYSPNSLVDYKVYCFNGKPECVNVLYDRTKTSVYNRLYDLDWNEMPEKVVPYKGMRSSKSIFPKPKCLNEMLNYASILSQPFPEVRVDFYVINDQPVFGELTLSTGYGDFTKEYYNYLGAKVDLTKVKKVSMESKLKRIKNIK